MAEMSDPSSPQVRRRTLLVPIIIVVMASLAVVASMIAIREGQARSALSREVRQLQQQLIAYQDIADQQAQWAAEHYAAEVERRAAERAAYEAQQAAAAAEQVTPSAP